MGQGQLQVIALVVGGAACLQRDLDVVRPLLAERHIIVSMNRTGAEWPGPLDHWVSLHPELFPSWITERHRLGHPPCDSLWTGTGRPTGPKLPEFRRTPNWGGSSGLLAVSCAMTLGASRVVLAGVPLDFQQGHYYSPDKRWHDGGNYRHAWERKLDVLQGRVRSPSGFTREILGEPTAEWLAGGA